VEKKSSWEGFKKFVRLTILCSQKRFKVDGEVFKDAKPTGVRNNMVAFSENAVLKVENFKHRKKKHGVIQEAEILKFLNDRNQISPPKLIKTGALKDKRKYLIMERIEQKGECPAPDIILSVIEQQKTGLFHKDLKKDNMIFDGSVVRFIDYDQAEFIDGVKNLSPYESVEYFIAEQTSRWGFDYATECFGAHPDEIRKEYFSYFKEGVFDFEKTSLYKNISASGLPYWSIDYRGISARGENDISSVTSVLDKIDFKKGEKILDYGCSTGALSFYLADRGCEVSACEKNPELVKCAKILSNILEKKCTFVSSEDEIRKQGKDFYETVFISDADNKSLCIYREFLGLFKRIVLMHNKDLNIAKLFPDFKLDKCKSANQGQKISVLKRITW